MALEDELADGETEEFGEPIEEPDVLVDPDDEAWLIDEEGEE